MGFCPRWDWVCSGEDEEGEEGWQQWVCPQACPAGWARAGCVNGASVRLLRGAAQIVSP